MGGAGHGVGEHLFVRGQRKHAGEASGKVCSQKIRMQLSQRSDTGVGVAHDDMGVVVHDGLAVGDSLEVVIVHDDQV